MNMATFLPGKDKLAKISLAPRQKNHSLTHQQWCDEMVHNANHKNNSKLNPRRFSETNH